jgi:hypothetical protein
MPDPILGTAANATDANQQGGTQQGQTAGTQQQNGSADPAWLNAIQDTTMRDEARKSYMLHSDYTKKTQEISEREKTWQQKEQELTRQNQEYLNGWRQSYGALEEAQRQYAQNPTRANAANVQEAQDEYWANYDPLDGPKAGKHVGEYAVKHVTEYANRLAQKFQENYQQAMQQQQQYINNYFGTWLDAQQRFPGNVEQQRAYLQSMYQVQSGQIPANDIAFQRVNAETERQKLIEEGRKLGQAEAEQRLKNQNQFDMNGNGAPQGYRYQPPADKKARLDELNSKITERFGYQAWNPNS